MPPELIDMHSIHSGRSTVLDHSIKCHLDVLSLTDLLHQVQSVSRGFALRVRSYARLSVTSGRGFTSPVRLAGQLSLAVLTFSAHRLAVLLPSPFTFASAAKGPFGPSAPFGSYYALC